MPASPHSLVCACSTATKDRVASPSVVALGQQDQVEAAASPIARVTSAATRPPHTAAEVESLDVEGSSLQPADTGTERSAVTSSNLLQPAPRWTVLKAAAAVAPLWFLAQLCFNVSLKMTSVTSNTILSSPASLFTFFMSVLVLGEKFSVAKLVAVLLTVAGAPACGCLCIRSAGVPCANPCVLKAPALEASRKGYSPSDHCALASKT